MKMIKALSIAAAIAGATAATGAVAQNDNLRNNRNTGNSANNISYNFVGLEYLSQRLDTSEFSCSQDGLNLYGNLDIRDGWFVRGNLTDVSGNRGCGSTTISIGGGYHTQFNDTFDMYGTVSFEDISIDNHEDDSGLALAAGLRGFVAERLEADLSVHHSTAGTSGTMLHGGLAYFFDERLAGTLGLGISGDETSISVGARYDF